MYCQNCGKPIVEGARFCQECGSTVTINLSNDQLLPVNSSPESPISVSQKAYEPQVTPNPINNSTGFLRITRHSAFMAGGLNTQVIVDGMMIGKVADGGSMRFNVYSGIHSVELKTPGNKGISKVVRIEPRAETIIRFKLTMSAPGYHKIIGFLEPTPRYSNIQPSYYPQNLNAQYIQPVAFQSYQPLGRVCPRCGGPMTIQTVSESRKSGCGTIFLYILLAITILGLLIIIPLALRKKTETVTYAVCQHCGYKMRS